MTGIFGDTVLIWQRMRILPCRDTRHGLSVRCKQIPCRGEYLLRGSDIRVVIDRVTNSGDFSDMVYNIHHTHFLMGG